MTTIDIFFVSTCSRAFIELERLLTVLEPANSMITLTELRAARPLRKETIRLTDSVGVAGVTLGGGGGGLRGDLTLLDTPGFNAVGIFFVEDFRSFTLVEEAIGEKTLAILVTASGPGNQNKLEILQ